MRCIPPRSPTDCHFLPWFNDHRDVVQYSSRRPIV